MTERLRAEDVELVPEPQGGDEAVRAVLRAVRRALYGDGTDLLRQWPEARGLADDLDAFSMRASQPCPRCLRGRT